MTRNGILAVGNLLVDRTLLADCYPEESMLALVEKVENSCGGGCTNTLFDLAKLNSNIDLSIAGAIADDSDGKFILSQIEKHKINSDGVVFLPGITSFTDVIINAKSGDRTFFHHLGVMDKYNCEHVKALQSKAKIIHFAYLPLLTAMLNQGVVAICKMLKHLQQQGFLISFDLVSVKDKKIYSEILPQILPYLDFLICNEVEATMLVGEAIDDFERLALKLIELGVKESVVIHHPHGASGAKSTGEVLSAPSFWVEKEKVVSALGAGDAFCAGALYAIHQNLPLDQILIYGNTMARFNLFSISATDGAIDLKSINQFITNNIAK